MKNFNRFKKYVDYKILHIRIKNMSKMKTKI